MWRSCGAREAGVWKDRSEGASGWACDALNRELGATPATADTWRRYCAVKHMRNVQAAAWSGFNAKHMGRV